MSNTDSINTYETTSWPNKQQETTRLSQSECTQISTLAQGQHCPATELSDNPQPENILSIRPTDTFVKPTGFPSRKEPARVVEVDPLLTADEVADRLRVSTDWVWDHSSRKRPYLPVIRMGDGSLRYRSSRIEAFIDERERLSSIGRRRSG